MCKYRNLYQHDGKWYTKETRVAKVGEKVLIVNKSIYGNDDYKNGDVLTVIKTPVIFFSNTRYGSDYGQYLEQSEYVVLVPRINGMEITDTWYDEMTSMEQQHDFVIQERGAGKKAFMAQLEEEKKEKQAQPVPFSMEYYNKPEDSKDLGNIPEKMTQEGYEKIVDNLWKTVNELDSRTGGLYRSVYVSYAERVLAELNKRIVLDKRKWTDTEILEAKQYVADKMYSLTKEGKFLLFYTCSRYPDKFVAQMFQDGGGIDISGFAKNNLKISAIAVKTSVAKCCPTDTFNYAIGKMVATKKLFNEELPEWVKGCKK